MSEKRRNSPFFTKPMNYQKLTGFVSSRGYEWEYFVFGTGPEILIAFHGFDNDANDFRIFQEVFGKRYTLVAVNLFYHGKSRTPGKGTEDIFTTPILLELFNQILFKFSCEKFSLMGFSLGGRIVLELIPYYEGRIGRVLLLAPDGLRISRWYTYITRTKTGNFLFKRVVYDASRFLLLAKLFHRIKLVGDKQFHFAIANFDTPEKRKKVYNVWMIFRYILPDPVKIGSALRKNPIPVDIYFGKRDTIIRFDFGISFNKKSGYPAQLHLLDAGHNLMKEKTVHELKSWVEDKKKLPE